MKDALTNPENPNSGHGHVYVRPDRERARCGGPRMCRQCQGDLARKTAELDQAAEPEPDFSDAERLGLAVVATLTEAQREAEQARAIAVRLEQELAEAVAICRDALGAWPETTWAADSMRKATLEDRLAKLTDPDGDA